jgi:hypothetical protein
MPELRHKDFLELFPPLAEKALARYPQLSWNWQNETLRKTLSIAQQSRSGFEVKVVCEAYGLYPVAGDWHGPPWDITSPDATTAEKCDRCLEFLLDLLTTNTRLRILTANGKPYRWHLEHSENGGWKTFEEMGLLLFNYFGRRSELVLQNDQISPKELRYA